MGKLAKTIADRYVNVGTALFVMGAMWLYLWVFPWRQAYIAEPHWGHNYAEALAFFCVGLAYFNRRVVSDWLAVIATVLIIPASMELLPHMLTATLGGILAVLMIVDMFVERGRENDLLKPSSRKLAFWLRGHLLRFAYLMLAHIAFTYFLVRLPSGTYETDLVTKVYDGLLIPLTVIALMEGSVKTLWGVATERIGFFGGMATTIVSLLILSSQPETRICLFLAIVVTAVGAASLVIDRQPEPATA